MNKDIIKKIAGKLNVKESGIEAVLQLLSEDCTVPFIARYRKEKTGGLDEEQIRVIYQAYDYENKLLTRKEEVIRLIEEKGKLTEEIREQILACTLLKEVEDIYLPYKEKKKTRAGIAIANGLEGLSKYLLSEKLDLNIEEEAKKYLNEKVINIEDAINGAKDIVAEMVSDDKNWRDALRKEITNYGKIESKIKKNAVDEKKVFEPYYNFSKPVRYLENYQILALNRAEDKDIIKISLEIRSEEFLKYNERRLIKNPSSPAYPYLKEALYDGFNRLLFPSIEREIRSELTERADDGAIDIFQKNLEQLLLTPPMKNKMMLGLDPAYRTGCKLAVINGNGDFIEKTVIYPHQKFPGENVSEARIKEAEDKVVFLVKKYNIQLIAMGNGTASRESEEFIARTINKYKLQCKYIIVSEAGASVYSASELAKKEFPDLVVEERSAISIARRVIDPLAELIKIDPKSIGVGQYQHDVNQKKLEESLDFTISKVVNNVGVNLNSASPSLLKNVSGLSKASADSIVEYRRVNGSFKDRNELKKVKGIGPKAYEQSIGFLKILESSNVLDKTFIHPDNYDEARKILLDLNIKDEEIGSELATNKLSSLDIKDVSSKYNLGEYTATDIINELKRPLRDIRDSYPTPTLKSDILHLEDLTIGMSLQGTVRSITDFGAFVDIGLHNDGMIHKSKMSKDKINHPLEVVSVGDIVEVYICEINKEKERVALSLIPLE